MTNINIIKEINSENDDIFSNQKDSQNNSKNKPEPELIKLYNNKEVFHFQTRAYGLLHGKLNINWTSEEKKEFVKKYWIINPKKKYNFYGNAIRKIWEDKSIYQLKNLIAISMLFKNYLSIKDIERFDNYFSVKIKCNERQYYKSYKNGKLLFIGGDLKCPLGEMLEKEFSNDNSDGFKENAFPIFMSIMEFDEYEKIELEGIDFCDKIPEHCGFINFPKVFHQNFPKVLSTKVKRIKNEKNDKKEKLRIEDEKNNNL